MFDWAGVLSEYNTSPDGVTADNAAIERDWIAVGRDMQEAIESCRRDLNARKSKS